MNGSVSGDWPAEGAEFYYISTPQQQNPFLASIYISTWHPAPQFLRGDVNADGELEIADAVFALTYLFASGDIPACQDSADANDDGVVDIADAIATIWYFFRGKGPLPEPFGECGTDPTEDTLDCTSYEPCER
jgi:hypothetical protein